MAANLGLDPECAAFRSGTDDQVSENRGWGALRTGLRPEIPVRSVNLVIYAARIESGSQARDIPHDAGQLSGLWRARFMGRRCPSIRVPAACPCGCGQGRAVFDHPGVAR